MTVNEKLANETALLKHDRIAQRSESLTQQQC
jgi:hypothetical protein